MKDILLIGQMAAGKTTIAAALGEMGYVRQSFADGVKDIAAMAYGRIDKGGTYLIHELGMGYIEVTGREILQRVGQDIKRIDQDFWLRIIEQKMIKRVDYNEWSDTEKDVHYVIDDGRFDFELDWCRLKGFLIVGVNTPEPMRIQRYQTVYGRTPTVAELTHISETQVPQLLNHCDVIVQGSADPYDNVRKIMSVF